MYTSDQPTLMFIIKTALCKQKNIIRMGSDRVMISTVSSLPYKTPVDSSEAATSDHIEVPPSVDCSFCHRFRVFHHLNSRPTPYPPPPPDHHHPHHRCTQVLVLALRPVTSSIRRADAYPKHRRNVHVELGPRTRSASIRVCTLRYKANEVNNSRAILICQRHANA